MVELGIVFEVLGHAKSAERGVEEASWTFASLAGKKEHALVIACEEEVIRFLSWVTQSKDTSSCLQASADFSTASSISARLTPRGPLQAVWALGNLSAHVENGTCLAVPHVFESCCIAIQRPEVAIQQHATRCIANILKSHLGRELFHEFLSREPCAEAVPRPDALETDGLVDAPQRRRCTPLSVLLDLANADTAESLPCAETAVRSIAHAFLLPASNLAGDMMEVPGLIETMVKLLSRDHSGGTNSSFQTTTSFTLRVQDSFNSSFNQKDVQDLPRLLVSTLTCVVNLTSIARTVSRPPSSISDLAAPLIELTYHQSVRVQTDALNAISNLVALGEHIVLELLHKTTALQTMRQHIQTASPDIVPLCERVLSALTEKLTPHSRGVFVERSCVNKKDWHLTASLPRRSSPLVRQGFAPAHLG